MKKEKKVRTYQRRTKTGKLVTVKQHTAKYDAAEKAKEMLKKKGAGDEFSAKKKTKPVSSAGELAFSQADFKAWYHWDQENDPKNPTALKVEKALKAKMGAKGYRKFFNDMSDSYSARGHLKAYKECSACGNKTKSKVAEPKSSKELRSELSAAQDREAKMASKKARAESKSAKDSAGVSHKEVVAFMKGLGKRKWSWSREENAFVTNRDAQGRPMRGISKMSMESAIKKMQKAQGKADSSKSSEKEPTKASSKDLQSKIDTLKEKAGYNKKGVSFRVVGGSGKYSVRLDGGRTMDKTFKTKREAQEALVGELTKMTKESDNPKSPRARKAPALHGKSSKGPYTKEAKKTKLPAHYVNRYKKEMSKLPESEWEKFF